MAHKDDILPEKVKCILSGFPFPISRMCVRILRKESESLSSEVITEVCERECGNLCINRIYLRNRGKVGYHYTNDPDYCDNVVVHPSAARDALKNHVTSVSYSEGGT